MKFCNFCRRHDVLTVIVATMFAMLAVAALGKAQQPKLAPNPDPEVDAAEVKRLGNHVQHVDGKIRASDDYTEAMGPPADDNHKWFISIIGTKNCPACAKLKADLKRDEYLRALITVHETDDNHSDTKTSWAHYTYYLGDDKSQAFRWEKIKITAYPTIIVQPPINKKFGPPSDVVCQITGYDGDGKKLATEICTAIKAYLAKQAQRRDSGHRAMLASLVNQRDQSEPPKPLEPPAPQPQGERVTERSYGQDIGIDPPWTPAPKVDPTPGPSPGPNAPPVVVFPPLLTPPGPNVPTPDANPLQPAPVVDGSIPLVPEVTIVVDKATTSEADTDEIVRRLKLRRPNLIAKIKDFREARNLNVSKDEVPAVVVTADGQVKEKLGGKLLPFLLGGDGVTVTPSVNVAMPEIPWSAIVAFLAAPSLMTCIPLILGGLYALRQWRKARGQTPILPDAIADVLLKNPEALLAVLAKLGIKLPEQTKTPAA